MKKLLALLSSLLLATCTPAFAATTTHYSIATPTVGGSLNTWGTTLNTAIGNIDTYIWAAANGTTIGVNAPSSSGSNITLTNPINNVQNISFSTTGKSLILSAMNATASPVPGGMFYVTNVGSNTFSILENDASTVLVSALAPNQTVSLQLLTNSSADGTFLVYGPYLTSIGTLALGTSTSAASPSISGDATSGFYTPGAAEIDVAISGAQTMQWDATGVYVPGLTASELVATTAGKYLASVTALPNGTTATAQSAGDTTSKVATDAFVNTTALTLATGTTAVTQSAADTSTDVATDAFVNTTALTLATGTTAVTQSAGDSSTKVATDAFVQASGGLTLLHTINASGASSVVFSSTYITSTYNKYVIEFDGVYGSTNGVTMLITISTNNGSTYLSTGYNEGGSSRTNSGGGTSPLQNDAASFILANTPSFQIDSGSTSVSQGTIKFSNPSASKMFNIQWEAMFNNQSNGAGQCWESGGGIQGGTTPINNIKITLSSGNMTGNFHLYGLQGN